MRITQGSSTNLTKHNKICILQIPEGEERKERANVV